MSVSEEIFNATARVERIIWIPGAVADPECTPEDFHDGFVDDLPNKTTATLYESLPVLLQFAGDEPRSEYVAEALIETQGFLVQAATPVRDYYSDTGCSFSWGYYQTEWLYAATEADISSVVIAWAGRVEADQNAKAKKEQP